MSKQSFEKVNLTYIIPKDVYNKLMLILALISSCFVLVTITVFPATHNYVYQVEEPFSSEKAEIENILGAFDSKVVFKVVEEVVRDGYTKAPNEYWSGNVEYENNLTTITLDPRSANSEEARYYLAKARLEEIRSYKTSPWILVGLPHCLRVNNYKDKESLRIIRRKGISDLSSPDFEMMKNNPEYRAIKRGESWLVVYYLLSVKNIKPLDLLNNKKFEFPAKDELEAFLDTL